MRKQVIGQNEEHEHYQHLGGESRYSGSVSKSCSTTGNLRVTLVINLNLVTIHERLKEDRIVATPQIIRTG